MRVEFSTLHTLILRLLTATGFSCAIGFWIFESRLGIIAERDSTVTYPVMLFVFATSFLLLGYGGRCSVLAVWASFLVYCANCASGILSFGIEDPDTRLYAVANTLQWMVLIYVIAILIFPRGHKIPACIMGFLITMGTASWLWLSMDPSSWKETYSALLVNTVIINILSVAVLWLFSHSITGYEQAQRHARDMENAAFTDILTGVANRRGLERALARHASSCGQPVALILLDMDRFKVVNDTRGHIFGDCVLRAVGQRLSAVLRGVDVIGRWGGDEFMVLVDGASPEEAERLADRLREAVATLPENEAGGVTLSAGIAMWYGDGGLDEALRRVDAALYSAKHQGRDRVAIAHPDPAAYPDLPLQAPAPAAARLS